MSRSGVVTAVGGLAVVVGALLGAADRDPVTPTATAPSVAPAGRIEVHVAGWVRSPGVVRLPEGSMVADAIEAAGGFKPGAVTHAVNLAAPVRDGDQILVSGPGMDVDTAGLVALNRATASELETLPGVGPVLAERIVAYRDEHGPFQEVEELLDVPGIGESKLASLRDLIRVP